MLSDQLHKHSAADFLQYVNEDTTFRERVEGDWTLWELIDTYLDYKEKI